MFATADTSAVIGALGIVCAALIAALIPLWSTHRRIGKPNGGGTVVGEIVAAAEAAKEAVRTAQEVAEVARTSLGQAVAASQLAASLAEANGVQIGDLARRMTSLENEVLLQPGHGPLEGGRLPKELE